jgi:hypothetical protein
MIADASMIVMSEIIMMIHFEFKFAKLSKRNVYIKLIKHQPLQSLHSILAGKLLLLLPLGLLPLDYLECFMDLLGMIGDRFLIEGEGGEPHWQLEEFIILVSLLNDEGVHLPEDESCRLASHVLRANAMLDGIRRVGVFFHL